MGLCKDTSVSYSPLSGSSRASDMPRGYSARLVEGEAWPGLSFYYSQSVPNSSQPLLVYLWSAALSGQ